MSHFCTAKPCLLSKKMIVISRLSCTLIMISCCLAPVARSQSSKTISLTPISKIQGANASSPLAGDRNLHTVSAIVTKVFPGLDGFFIEEESADHDNNDGSSEGLFVSMQGATVNLGNRVVVSGRVAEHGRGVATETRLVDAAIVRVDSDRDYGTQLSPAVVIALPQPTPLALESYEGMRVSIGEPLFVTDSYNLGSHGQVTLSAGSPLRTPTAVASPGRAANDKQRANRLNQIVLDDGRSARLDTQAESRVPYINKTGDRTLRRGSVVCRLSGFLSHGQAGYTIHPASQPSIQYAKRPKPPQVKGDLAVACLNLLNYFTTIDDGSNGARGADSQFERKRQKAKLLSTIKAINADVIGLCELENGEQAIRDLVDDLSEYEAVPLPGRFPEAFGAGYPVRVGLIYRRSAVSLAGEPTVISHQSFGEARAPISQSFLHEASGKTIEIIVCHLKSKGRSPTDPDNPDADQADGQGAWNATRRLEALALLQYVDSVRSISADQDVLLMGDFNAYPQEDPIQVLLAGGLRALASGDSYVFRGQSGALDYIFGTEEISERGVSGGVWNLNSDEPRVLDYKDSIRDLPGDRYESVNPDPALYQPGPYRSSDHDPVVVGVSLGGG